MKFLQLICIERDTTDAENAVMRNEVGAWVDDTISRRINVTGKPLDAPSTAKTVRVRNGETLVSDGPFADTKEFIGGLDILECESLDEAIEVASKHPVAWFHAIELHAFDDGMDGIEIPDFIDPSELKQLLLVCVDGVPESPEVEAQIALDAQAWRAELERSGVQVLSQPLKAGGSTMVRVRERETLVSDGPFVETKEFLAGIDILSCDTLDTAVGWASKHPLAGFHMVEARSFRDL